MHNRVNRKRHIERQRVCWFFQRFKLTLEHLRFHIMILAAFEAGPDQLITALEVNELNAFIVREQLLAVTLL